MVDIGSIYLSSIFVNELFFAILSEMNLIYFKSISVNGKTTLILLLL